MAALLPGVHLPKLKGDVVVEVGVEGRRLRAGLGLGAAPANDVDAGEEIEPATVRGMAWEAMG